MYVYGADIPKYRFRGLYLNYPQMLELTLSQSLLPRENAGQFSAPAVIHIVPIFIPHGTHYCWVDRGGEDSKLAQGVYA